MMKGNLGNVYAKVDREQPVQILSEAWDVRRTRRIKGTHLKADDLGQAIFRELVERSAAIAEQTRGQPRPYGGLDLVNGIPIPGCHFLVGMPNALRLSRGASLGEFWHNCLTPPAPIAC